jgi:hypothetical protein
MIYHKKKPVHPRMGFFMIYHVPRLILDQCSTVLISPGEQLDQPYGLEAALEASFFGF